MNRVPAKHVDRMTISLPKIHAKALRELADRDHRGNVSGAVARLIEERFVVTKSGTALPR